MGVFQKFLYLVCFVSKQDLEDDERHRTNAKAQKEHDIQEATKFFRESKFWKRLFLASYLTLRNHTYPNLNFEESKV